MIIKSLLDTDYYKLTMPQVILHQHPAAMVRYAFKCRNGIDLAPYVDEIREEVQHLCSLRFTQNELSYLSKVPYFKPDYIEYLRLLQLNPDYIKIYIEDNKLKTKIEGPWISTIWFEVPVLAIVSEVYTKHQKMEILREGITRLDDKIQYLNNLGPGYKPEGFEFADFSTRRRASYDWQDYMLCELINKLKRPMLIGTSNVYFAKKYNIKAIGTMAHEYIMAYQQLVRLKDSQKVAFQNWANEYRGELGIALSDTVGMDTFIRDFDLYFAKLFDGARHDSGDPFEWGYKWVKYLRSLGIDSKTKSGVFSDSLDFEKALEIYLYFHDSLRTSFGIGGYLGNDMGFENPNIVIKMVECNGGPIAKISDSKGKGMCEDPEHETLVKKIYDIRRD